MQLVLDTKGIVVKKRNGCFHLQTTKHERLINPHKVTSIAVTSHCTLSSSAIRLAIVNGIPIYFLDFLGNVEGRLWTGSFGNLSTIRRYQVLFNDTPEAILWAKQLFMLKLQNQVDNLDYLKSKHKSKSTKLDQSINALNTAIDKINETKGKNLKTIMASMLGIEGSSARAYWQAIAECMPIEWHFDERSRQPAKDRFNALLNYMYGMLYGIIETTIFSAGLDPYLGVFHADQYNKPTLSFDIIEAFRGWIDRLLLEGIIKWDIKDTFFEELNGGVGLSKAGKAFIIPIFNQYWAERTLHNHKNILRKAHISRFVYELIELLKKTFENQ